jgi:hypothetical protein
VEVVAGDPQATSHYRRKRRQPDVELQGAIYDSAVYNLGVPSHVERGTVGVKRCRPSSPLSMGDEVTANGSAPASKQRNKWH